MPFVTVIEAAVLVGKSPQTIYRHIKSGKLSRAGSGKIDTSELMRVYGAISNSPVKNVTQDVNPLSHNESNESNNEKWLKKQIEQLQTDLKELKTESLEREKRLMALLENKSQEASQPKEEGEAKKFFRNLFN